MRSCGRHEQSSSFKGVPFLEQFSSILECYLAAYGPLLICGGHVGSFIIYLLYLLSISLGA